MKSKVFLWPVLALAVTLTAQAQQGKFAVINIQGAIISTKDGQKAAAELNAKTAPKKKELEQKQNEINGLQDQLNKGSNTLSDTAKNDLYKNIEAKKKSLQREVEDAQADLEADQNKLLQQLGQKILAVIEKYARDNGYTMVVDVSSPQTPVLYASPSIDITKEIIELYDKNTASAGGRQRLRASPGSEASRDDIRLPNRRPSPRDNSRFRLCEYSLRVELASGRKLRDRNKPAYRLAHWPIWIFVFFIAPGPSTFDLFERGFDQRKLVWLGLVILGTGIAALRGRLPGVEPRPYIIRFVEDKPNPLYRRICYTFAWSIVITFAVLNFAGLAVAVATGAWRLKQIYEYGYFPLAILLWALGAMGLLPRVKASTKGEGHERRYFYGAVWASCVAQPVLGIMWKLLPHTRSADVAKLVVFTGLLAFCGILATARPAAQDPSDSSR